MTSPPASTEERWTTSDLEGFALEEGKRYEIVEGELHVSTQPHWVHQVICSRLITELNQWSDAGSGGMAVAAPGIIFDVENAVAPDVVWVSRERMPLIVGDDGKLHDAPELVVEVLSPGAHNTRRDREAKLRLYSIRGVREYWIVDWQARSLQIYRREDAALRPAATLFAEDELASPLLPGFAIRLARLFPA